MKQLAYMFFIGLLISGCAGLKSHFPFKPILPIDFSEADKNSREIWFEFEDEVSTDRMLAG